MSPEALLSPFMVPDLPRRELYANLELSPGALLTLYLPHNFLVDGQFGGFSNFKRTVARTDEPRVYPYRIRREGILQPFREMPEYRYFIRAHQGRLPTEDMLVHVFWCQLEGKQGEPPVVNMVSFYPQDRFLVNGTDFVPPPIPAPELIRATTGGSEQYMNVTDVGKRICRLPDVAGVRVSMPVPDKLHPLYVAEMPLTIEISTASRP